MTPPTPTEVEELARELRLQAWHSDPHQFARWILTRFVRREEHPLKIAALANDICGLMLENDRLRAELKGQRCDGSGTLFGLANKGTPYESPRLAMCKGCPACKPTDDGGRTRESVPKCYCVAYYQPDCLAHKPDGSPLPAPAPVNYCPECDGKPDATPKGDGGATIGYGWHMNYGDGSRDREVVSEAGERDCNATPAGEDQSPAFRPDAPVRGCPRHTPYWCYPCDDCSEILRRKHEAEAAAPVHVSLTPERMSLLEHHCSDADFATIGKLRDESYAAGYQAGRDDAARLNIQQVSHVVELGPATLRALVAALLSDHQRRDVSGVEWADALLTNLREKEMK